MSSRQNILNKIRNRIKVSYPIPSYEILSPIEYQSNMDKFIASTKLVGGRVICADNDQDVNQLIKSLYPEYSTIASSLPYIHASINPDCVSDVSELNGVEIGVVEGQFGVAENGCVWIPQTMKERAVLFISECLVIIIDRNDIVSNMHQAYERIQNDSYGCFISGPSKTADIAQALVMGAQAAREVLVLIK